MALYNLNLERTQFYSRQRQDIVDVISNYKTREKSSGNDTRPDSFSVKISPEVLDTITEVKEGFLRFHVGPLFMPQTEEEGKKDVFHTLQVLPDFSVGVSYEASAHFDRFRRSLSSQRRVNLYKVQVDNGLFGGLYFVPEDVVDAIVSFDLSDLLSEGKIFRERIAGVSHPNLRFS